MRLRSEKLEDKRRHIRRAATKVFAKAAGDVRIAAASALGEVGSARAVEMLHLLASSLLGGRRARVAADSIKRIQSRIAGAEHGQLSVAGPTDAGALSEPSAPRPAATKKQTTT